MGKSTTFYDFKPTPKAGKKAAIYVRVSRNEFKAGADGEMETRQSVKTQRADAIDICRREGWEHEIYDRDCEFSGTLAAGKQGTGRPDLERLLQDVRDHRIHTIIVRDIKRFARNGRHLKEMIFDDLIPNGVVLKGTNQPLDITTPEGRVFVTMLGEFAELEVYNIRDTSMRNRAAKAKEGTLLLNPYCYGYDNQQGKGPLVIVEKEKAVVRRIFEMYTHEHLSCARIANKLNEEGVPTKWKGRKTNVNGERTKGRDFSNTLWVAGQIWKCLRNRRYIGEIEFNKQIFPSPFPPIVDQQLWDDALVEMARRKTIAPKVMTSRHLLSGILKCGYCLENLTEKLAKGIKIAPGMVMTQAGTKEKPHRYYTCQTKSCINSKYCQGSRVPKEKIEDFIEQFVGVFAAEQYNEAASNNADAQVRLKQEIQSLHKQLERVQKKKDALAAKFLEAASMNVETLVKADELAKQEISRLEREIAALQRELSEISLAESRNAFDELKDWKRMDLQSKRVALQKAIPLAVMYDDRLELFLGSPKNRPVVVPYVEMKKRRKARFFPEVSGTWPVFMGEGKIVRYGAKIDVDGKILAYR